MGFADTYRFNVRWLQETCRILKLDAIWITGTRNIIFSLGFALQSLKFKVILNQTTWAKPDPPPNALHTAFTSLKAVVVRHRLRLRAGL